MVSNKKKKNVPVIEKDEIKEESEAIEELIDESDITDIGKDFNIDDETEQDDIKEKDEEKEKPEEPVATKPIKHHLRKRYLFIIIASVIFIAVLSIYVGLTVSNYWGPPEVQKVEKKLYYCEYGVSEEKCVVSDENINVNPDPFSDTNADYVNSKELTTFSTDLSRMQNPQTGEVWLSSEAITAVKGICPYKEVTNYCPTDSDYLFKIGTRNGRDILSYTRGYGSLSIFFEMDSDGILYLIAKPNILATYTEGSKTYQTSMLSDSVVIDETTYYDSISIPDKITLSNGITLDAITYELQYGGNIYAGERKLDSLGNTIETYGGNRLALKEEKDIENGVTSGSYKLILPIQNINSEYVWIIYLNYEPIPTEITPSNFNFSSGIQATNPGTNEYSSFYSPITSGCGSNINYSAVESGAGLVQVGNLVATNEAIYQQSDINTGLNKITYDEYDDMATNAESYSPEYERKYKNIEEFSDAHGLIYYQDKAGKWLAYSRSDVKQGEGCGKPVVYLYPEKTENVSVKIGADVKISVPLYNPKTGWNVVASPTGELTVNGKTYDSLFWEGIGKGEYPVITSGIVVKKDQAIPTIKSQLLQQGLNSKEIADFVAYWKDNLPKKPYIRISWLNTEQMDILAPLKIIPKPDSVIRVFMDAKGLEKPINIPAQSLKTIPRNGFTVIEWGGLITNPKF